MSEDQIEQGTRNMSDDNGPDGMLAHALAIQAPDRNDPTWPMPSFNGRDWAEAFAKQMASQGITVDEGQMLAWFCGALMRGYDEAQMRAAQDPTP